MFISEETLDDILKVLFEKLIQKETNPISASKGSIFSEEIGALIELRNPRARLSRSELKGTIFSCLGELSWYLSGSDELSHMTYYIARYDKSSDDGITVRGAYGPRLRNMHGKYNQLENVINLLQRKPTSRRAAIQLFDASDIDAGCDYNDIPCTTTIQFFVRDDKLEMVVHMRSNDVFLGLPHDIFCFTMLQEIFANRLGLRLGPYKHSVGSLHLYERDVKKVEACIEEGWHRTIEMPEMPTESISAMIDNFLDYEKSVRLYGYKKASMKTDMPLYWKDLMLILKAFSVSKNDSSLDDLKKVKSQIHDENYNIYLEKLEQKLEQKKI